MRALIDVVSRPSGFDSLKNFLGDIGETSGFDCLLTQTRDSGCLETSNFRSALALLGGESEAVQVFRYGHWACGWWEALAVKQGTEAHVKALAIEADMADYPVIDEDDFSNLEQEEALKVWQDCYTWRDRVQYIREKRAQFEAQTFADLLGCVRGDYFLGYANELID
jgi:hypothetical protein